MTESTSELLKEDDGAAMWTQSVVEKTTKMIIYFSSLYFVAYEEWQATGQKMLEGNLNGHNEGEPCSNMLLKWFCILMQSEELQCGLVLPVTVGNNHQIAVHQQLKLLSQ